MDGVSWMGSTGPLSCKCSVHPNVLMWEFERWVARFPKFQEKMEIWVFVYALKIFERKLTVFINTVSFF